MKTRSQVHAVMAAVMVVMAGSMVVSCGGGGGGGGGGGAPAAIDSAAMTTAVPEFSAILPVCKTASAMGGSTTATTTSSLLARFATARSMASAGGAPLVVGALTSTPPADKFGDCGGKMSYPSYSHTNGVTTATLAYDNYCTSNSSTGKKQILNGQIPFVNTATPTASGPITTKLEASSPSGITMITRDSAGVQLTSQTSAFNNFVYTVGVPGGSPTAASPDRMTLGNATMTDNVTGKSYREENYSVTTFDTASGGQQMTMSGRGYRSSGDYFDLSTTTPFVTNSSGATTGGEITVTGAGTSTAVLTLVPGTVLQATLKVNGTAYTSAPACK